MSQKMIKRVLAFVLSFAMVLSSMSIGLAATVAKVKAGTPAATVVGSDVTVPITMEENTASIHGLRFEVIYDAEVLEYKLTTAGDLLKEKDENDDQSAGGLLDVNDKLENGIGVAYISLDTPIAANGELCNITFTAKKATTGTPVEVKVTDALDANYNSLEVDAVNGEVVVNEPVQYDYTIKGTDATTKQGETATVEFNVTDNKLAGVNAAEIAITYNADALTVEEADVVAGELLQDATTDANVNVTGSIGVMTIAASDIIKGDGKLLSVTFTAKSDAEVGKYPIEITIVKLIDKDTDLIDANGMVIEGSVTITEKDPVVDPLPAYKEEAKKAIDDARATYADTDYDAESVEALNQAVTDAKAAIDEATTMDAVDTAKQAGLDALAAVETKAQKAQKEADKFKEDNKDILAKEVSDVVIADEAAVDAAITDYEKLSDAAKELVADEKAKLDAQKAQIELLKSDAAVQEEVNKFKEDNKDILAKTTDNVAIADEAAVDAAIADYEKLSDAAKGLVTAEKDLLDSLKAKIAELKSDAAVQEEADKFKEDNKDILAKTTDNVAIGDEAAVDVAIADYEKLSDAAKELVTAEKDLLDSLKAAIEAQKTALADAKKAAADELDIIRGLYIDSQLTDEQKAALDQIVTDAKASIEQQTTIPDVTAELEKAKAALNETVPTPSLEDAKAQAKAQIDAARAQWNDKDLSKSDIEQLNQLVTDAKAAIDAEDTLDAVVKATQDGIDAINAFTKTPSTPNYIPIGSGSVAPPDNDDDNNVVIPEADASARVYRNIVTGQKGQITIPSDDGVSVQFTSSQPTIATVSQSGLIETLKAGKTNISVYVTKGNITTKTTVRLTVKDKTKVPTAVRDLGNVTIASTGTPVTTITKSMKVNTTSTFKIVKEGNATVSYSVKNSKIATVTSTGKITAKKAGTTKVVAAVNVNGQIQKYRVTITVTK